MKKTIVILLLALCSFAPQNAIAIPISDSGAYKSGHKRQQQADEDVQDTKQDAQGETSLKN